jgi:hypothetical protein
MVVQKEGKTAVWMVAVTADETAVLLVVLKAG